MSDIRTETMTVNMGPQHPSTHGVLRLVLELDGEVIQSVIPTIGYLHTGIEKTAEQKKWQQVIPLVERMDYLGAQSNSLSYALSVEKLLGLEMPQRVKDIRVLIAELQRIASHLIWVGTHGLEIGAVSMLFYAVRERELLLNINELIAGFRFFPSYIRIGGLREDLPRGFHAQVKEFLDRFPGKIDEFEGLLTKNDVYQRRTQGVGVITREHAYAWGLVGPIARAGGSDYDVRKYFPYCGYETYDFKVPVAHAGDTYARYLVRVEEIRQSLRIVEQALERLWPGPVITDNHNVALPPKEEVYTEMESLIWHFKLIMEGMKVPAGEKYGYTEAANGELGYYIVSDGGGHPYRIKVRPPCFAIFQAFPHILEGHMVADTVAIMSSLNVIAGELDR